MLMLIDVYRDVISHNWKSNS